MLPYYIASNAVVLCPIEELSGLGLSQGHDQLTTQLIAPPNQQAIEHPRVKTPIRRL